MDSDGCYYCGDPRTPYRVVPSGWVEGRIYRRNPQPCCRDCYRSQHTAYGPSLMAAWLAGCTVILVCGTALMSLTKPPITAVFSGATLVCVVLFTIFMNRQF